MEQIDRSVALRALPSVDRVLRSPPVAELLLDLDRQVVTQFVRRDLASYRARLEAGGSLPPFEEITASIAGSLREIRDASPIPVINATGVVLHTNLGRAPLSEAAIQAVIRTAQYSDLELDLESGERGSRYNHVEPLLKALTGAEAAHVTVNNAAAVLLALSALAKGREVLVSRGQSVEIGGGFRVPVILRQSGAKLVEVGTTNRTRIDDYAQAVTHRTAAILHVHPSNFRILGFTESASLQELAVLARERDITLIADNGSGSLLDTARFGLAHEPTPVEALHAGAEVVAFSGDKLLGGPQAGILLGERQTLRHIAKHPLARAVRPDKVTLAALTATLLSYARGRAEIEIPVWQMIAQDAKSMAARAADWKQRAAKRGLVVSIEPGESAIGGGSLPGETLATSLILLPPEISPRALRVGTPAVVARTRGGQVLLDLRTVRPREEEELLEAVVAAAHGATMSQRGESRRYK